MLKYRLPSGITLITLLLISIFWESAGGRHIFMTFGMLMAFFAVKEFLNMIAQLDKKSYSTVTAITGVISISSIFVVQELSTFTIPFFIVTILTPWFVILFSKNNPIVLDKTINSSSAFYMVILPLCFLALIYMSGENIIGIIPNYSGRYLVLYMILVTKFGDIGAYFTGTISNKVTKGKNHPIVPVISPKKSWEGTIGGCLLSIVVSIVLVEFILVDQIGSFIGFWQAIIIGFVLFVGGFTGDLVESSLKRTTGVKDSGNILPGMGGVLDVLDSLLLNAPIFYYLITYVM